ncbi:MAG: OmpH family outer membrane protein [Chthoniobacteraceae bacterium]
MKKLLTLTSLIIVSLIGSALSANAQLKVGTVDMNKIFSSYYKTKDAESRINEARNEAKKELDDRMDTHKKALDEINGINDQLKKSELSKDAKDKLNTSLNQKIADFRTAESEITDFKNTREKQLQEQAVRMRNSIVQEINGLVQAKVKSDNYDLVFDKSGMSLNGVPILVYSRDAMDFSDDIITQLNKNKPKDTSAPAAGAKN